MTEKQLWKNIVSVENYDIKLFENFSCGEAAFDEWLQRSSKTASARGECVTHICVDSTGMPVAFFTLSATSISPGDVSSQLRGGLHGSIPATLLGKMGVRTDLQGTGCGTRVLHHAMKLALITSELVSSRLLVVDALTTDLVPWYVQRGFRKLPQSERRLVCKMSDIRKICEQQEDGYFVY